MIQSLSQGQKDTLLYPQKDEGKHLAHTYIYINSAQWAI